jgi:ribose-phosphate pyrophosphokinase
MNAVPIANFDNVMPTYQMLKALLRDFPDVKMDKQHTMVVAPDEGAADRAIYYSSLMGLDMGMFYKRRDYTTIVNGRNPIIAHEYLGDSVENKDVFIADDIISTGESMLDMAAELKKRKVGRVFLAASFPLFTEGLRAFDKAYEAGLFDKLYATNLIHLTGHLRGKPWFGEVNMSKYVALLIATLNHDTSIAKLLNPSERIAKLLNRHNTAKLEARP